MSATRAAGRRHRRSPCQGIKILQRATRNQEYAIDILTVQSRSLVTDYCLSTYRGRLVQSPTREFHSITHRLHLSLLKNSFNEAPAFFLDDMQRSFSNGFDLKLKGFKTATVIGNKTVRYQTKSNYWLVTYEFD
ncbi:hypothetical protein L1887_11655 [Cichorium endivia]|nr:hypothetical protein L1887_11655 [Cichorium endivia]